MQRKQRELLLPSWPPEQEKRYAKNGLPGFWGQLWKAPLCEYTERCHPADWNAAVGFEYWIPAFAGMTYEGGKRRCFNFAQQMVLS